MTDGIITNFDGTTIDRSQKVIKLINYYQEMYGENLTDICDLSMGSEMRTLLESFTVETTDIEYQLYQLFKQTFTKYSTGYYLDLKACEQKINRKQGTVATGEVTFSLPVTLTSDYTIPRGTIILSRKKGYEYILASDVTILANSYTANGTVYSKLIGSEYNTEAGTLTAFEDIRAVRRDLQVTNDGKISGGTDTESDDDLRERVLNAKKERANGTLTAYKNLIESIEGVHDAAFINPNNVSNHYKVEKDSEGNEQQVKCTDCTRVIYVNGTTKPALNSVVTSVEDVMTHQDNIILGHEFHIQPATVHYKYFDVSVYNTGSIVSETDVLSAINTYFDGGTIGERTFPGLDIGENIRKSQMINAIEEIPEVEQVESIHELTYNTSIPSSLSSWNKVSSDEYTYNGDYNFVYTRSASTTNYWGTRNFDSINIPDYVVGCLGNKTQRDPNTEEQIGLRQTKA
ncbi:baseplate J/gp47 family protein [Methanosphaera sp.]